ncbi:MAG: hypothetical protein ACKO1U_01030 [Bacteroidota bacterium]
MIFATLYVIGIASFAYYRHVKQTRETANQESLNRKHSDWLGDWLAEKRVYYLMRETGQEKSYRFDYDLPSCRALITVFLNFKTNDLLADIALPMVIDTHRFAKVNDLIDSFEGRLTGIHLLLDANKGILHLRMEQNDNGFLKRSIPHQMEQFSAFLRLVDDVFSPIMTVVYGNNLPGLTLDKIFGARPFEMN